MARRPNKPPPPKISAAFARRLARLAPDDMARASVLLETGPIATGPARRPSKGSRKEMAETIRSAAAAALAEVDRQLELSGGRRLATGPDLFGSVAIEAPVSALLSLAASDHVRAILEDQPISLLRELDR